MLYLLFIYTSILFVLKVFGAVLFEHKARKYKLRGGWRRRSVGRVSDRKSLLFLAPGSIPKPVISLRALETNNILSH